jgi:Holliday junction resolvasome RuvABC endonuclease subunit
MKIFCVDPSSSSPGFACFKNDKPLWCKTIHAKGDTLLTRMAHIMVVADEMIDDDVDYIAVETPYLGISKSTSMKMGQIFGIFCAVFLRNGYNSDTIIEIHPMQAKKAAGVTHFEKREESKETVKQAMIKRFPELTIEDDNSSDALAIGLAAIERLKE